MEKTMQNHTLPEAKSVYPPETAGRLMVTNVPVVLPDDSIKNILRQPKTKTVAEFMIKELVTAHPYTDQERVAYLALKNNIKAVPVVDKQGAFLGVVPSDAILAVAYQEAGEDILRLGGVENFHGHKLDDTMKLSVG